MPAAAAASPVILTPTSITGGTPAASENAAILVERGLPPPGRRHGNDSDATARPPRALRPTRGDDVDRADALEDRGANLLAHRVPFHGTTELANESLGLTIGLGCGGEAGSGEKFLAFAIEFGDMAELAAAGWPLRWHSPPGEANSWKLEKKDVGNRVSQQYSVNAKGDATSWLRYENLVPSYEVWEQIAASKNGAAGAKVERGGETLERS